MNQSLEEMSAATPRTFVMGPWTHGAWNRGDNDTLGVLRFGSRTGQFFRDSIGFPFFACALKDRCGTGLPTGRMPDRGVDRPPCPDEVQHARRYANRLRQAITHGTRQIDKRPPAVVR